MKKQQQVRWRQLAAIVLLLLAGFFAYQLLHYWQESRVAEREFSGISRLFHAQNERSEPPEEGEPVPNPAIAALMEENTDFYAWLSIPGTKIDYPVMFTPENPEHYLRRNFQGEHSLAGTPFLDGRSTAESANRIIYGHNMKTGAMFADLLKFRDEAFRTAHSEIRLTSLYEEQRYQLIAAFPSAVHQERNRFPWFDYLSFPTEEGFQEFLRLMEQESLFPLPLQPVYGDQFLTLATCSYHESTGRFVLIALELPSKAAATGEGRAAPQLWRELAEKDCTLLELVVTYVHKLLGDEDPNGSP